MAASIPGSCVHLPTLATPACLPTVGDGSARSDRGTRGTDCSRPRRGHRRRRHGLPRRRGSPAAREQSIEEDYSEVCWFYDLDATPSMPEGPIAVNVFARLYEADAFFAVCRRMRLEGAKDPAR
jgi:hypothetical protein